jgi:hypothetical protein
MPDQVPDRARRGYHAPICRAAPTRPAAPVGAAGPSRRWLIVIAGGVTAALLAGASVALAATSASAGSGSGPAAPVPAATATATPGAGSGSGLSDP